MGCVCVCCQLRLGQRRAVVLRFDQSVSTSSRARLELGKERRDEKRRTALVAEVTSIDSRSSSSILIAKGFRSDT